MLPPSKGAIYSLHNIWIYNSSSKAIESIETQICIPDSLQVDKILKHSAKEKFSKLKNFLPLKLTKLPWVLELPY